MNRRKTKAVVVQLGSPKSPKVSDVRSYLKEFLGDPRVVDVTPWLWKIILNLFILPFRPKRSAKLYSRIWDGSSFPLITITEDFAKKVSAALPDKETVEVNHAFLLSSPRVNEVWDSWEHDLEHKPDQAATRLLAIAMFPQYSQSTVASGMDGFAKVLETRTKIPPFEFLTDFHRSHAFIDNSARLVDHHLKKLNSEKKVDKLILSFHGIPKRWVIYKGDAYYQHCYETFCLIRERLKEISSDHVEYAFQSRFGSEEWLTPYTEDRVDELIEEGHKNIAVYCPAFVADCLETVDEIGVELKEQAHESGGDIQHIPCLNDDDKWCSDFAILIDAHANGDSKTIQDQYIDFDPSRYEPMTEQKMKSPPLSPVAKSSIKIVFLTLFLDLIGFSIIFPLFPQLAKHYLETDGDNVFLKAIFGSIASLTEVGGADVASIVLFGGALGALYSLLQFIAAPIWGGISDRIGRKPVLLISVACLALSYGLWFFAGSFTILILARFVGGIMGGNISTATAVVADVTSSRNRSKGMAFVGIAFALGFIFGPALGGISAQWNLLDTWPELATYGVNPFSVPAAIAFVLSFINFWSLLFRFKETLPKDKRGESHLQRSFNPFKLFAPLPFPGVNLTNIGHFLFLMAFSGMEFTLTFLAFERLGYSPMDNAYMFIFIGFVLAMVQGGVVRRKASQVGEKKMAIMGLVSVLPGLILIGLAQSSFMIYFGLFFLAVGSAMAIPCLTSLVSLYSPDNEQGRSVGIFRSLGALARVIGPIAASLIYWKYGSAVPYFVGAVFLLIPILMISRLPQYQHAD